VEEVDVAPPPPALVVDVAVLVPPLPPGPDPVEVALPPPALAFGASDVPEVLSVHASGIEAAASRRSHGAAAAREVFTRA
jgi:hypothetical protein